MAEVITMPKLGFDMAEGTLVRWVIAEGEAVTKGAVLAEIETDKATVEVQSSADGIIYRHLVEAGAVVPVGTSIAVVSAPGEKVDESKFAVGVEKKEAAEVDPKQKNKKAEKDVKTEPESEPEPEIKDSKESVSHRVQPVAAEPDMLRVSPIARRMVIENALNIDGVTGTGPGGRIVKRDVEEILRRRREPGTAPAQVYEGKPIPSFIQGIIPADEVIPLDRLRTAIGKRMLESRHSIPHFYVTHDYDVEALMDMRTQMNNVLSENEKLSVNDFLIKAVALALRQYPNLNATLQDDSIIRKGHVNVGVAVAVEGGLLTVVVKDADQKSLRQISGEVKEMVARVRSGKVKVDDIEGSTFSISNLGMFDVEHFIAIINPPEAAILAVGSARQVAVVKEGVVQAGLRMRATLSADHRISDGAEAAQFLQALAKWVENPAGMML